MVIPHSLHFTETPTKANERKADEHVTTDVESGVLFPLLATVLLGSFFVCFQGVEWVRLIGEGLTMTSSALGSFFYLIVGLHALHAVVAIGLLVYVYVRLRQGWLSAGSLASAEVLWYFVVGVWPVLFLVVYR